jgi:hypothetical protein
LVIASVDSAWRFRNYARKLLGKVLKNKTFKSEIIKGMAIFSEKEKNYLEKILDKE